MRKISAKNHKVKTLKKLNTKKYQTSTSLQQDFPVSHSQGPTQREFGVFSERMPSFFSAYYDLLKTKDQNSYCLRTLKVYCPILRGVPLQRGSFTFRKWGTMRNGRILTALPLGCAVVMNISSSLDGIIKKSVPKKYYLTGKDLQYILSRIIRRNGRSFNVLLPKTGEGLTIAQLYLMSVDSEDSYQKKKRPYLGLFPDGPPSHQRRSAIKCWETYGHQ